MGPRGRGGGFRGGSRGGSRGGGGVRGRGGRGGRGARGRGRGGAAGHRFGPKRKFDSNRLDEKDDDSDADSASGDLPQEDEFEMDSAVSDGDEDAAGDESKVRPYMALLQSFTEDAAPKAKRRKVDHSSESKGKLVTQASEDEIGDSEQEEQDLDMVMEADEAEPEVDEQLDDDDDDSDDDNDDSDPFATHFASPNDQKVSNAIGSIKQGEWTTSRALVPPWRATMVSPGSDSALAPVPTVKDLDSLKLKRKLRETSAKVIRNFDDASKNFSAHLFNYRDVLQCDRTLKNSTQLQKLVCVHAMNHLFKTRDRVIKNNYKLAKEGENSELELRDQGFTRPKVLFLVPTRNSCAKIMNIIRDLCEPDQQEHRKRFDDSYIDKDNKFDQSRPADFRDLFEGNDDDMFRIGIKFTRKTIKYFSKFYNSDILFASPLGLRTAIGSEESQKKKTIDYDFLSSIEMVVVDQADALLMQNWEHVEYIFEHLNLQPKDAHDCDFSRVRNWYLEDWAKYFRQTVIMSGFNSPELVELFRTQCQNWAGKVRLQPEYAGVIQQLGLHAKQTFTRYQSLAIEGDPDARFEYFTTTIVPSLVKRAKDTTGTLIFIPSYLDFVRVRNYFANSSVVSEISFGAISEYADVPEASRARSHFVTGRHRVLLYTERAHHFRRYDLKGVQRVIFYALPDNPLFYKEIAGGYLGKSEGDMTIESGQGVVRAVFSRYDVLKLERIVGSKRVGKMIQDRGDTFEFV